MAWRGLQGRGVVRVVRGAGYASASGALVHEPVALKACLCSASLLEAHLLISTKEKNGVGNMGMSSPPCSGSRGPRARRFCLGEGTRRARPESTGRSWQEITSVFCSEHG